MRTTAIFNAKGGVGKTTTAVNLAAELAARGKRVCVVDADPQCNATDFLRPAGDTEGEYTLYDVLTGECDYAPDVTYPSRLEGIRVIPADENLALADLAALQKGGVRLTAIRDLVEAIAEDDVADFVLIDCPPGFTAATVSALAAADDVVIPMKLDAFSVKGERALVRQIDGMREFNPRLRVAGVLVTMDDPRTTVSKQGVELLSQSAIPVFNTRIHRSEAVNKSTFLYTPLRELPSAEKAANDYAAFCEEYLKGGAVYG